MRCLRSGVVDGCRGRKAKVVVVWLWLYGNEVCGGDLVVVGVIGNGGEAMFAGWSWGGKEAKVVVFELWLFGNDVGGGDLVVGG